MADDLLNSMLGNAGDDEEKQGGLGGLLGAAAGAPGAAKGAGEDALGGLASMLGGGGGDLMGMLGSLTGGGGVGDLLGGMAGGMDISSLPGVGPIISVLAEKFGLSPSQATALVTSALTMLLSRMKRSGAERMEEVDLDDWDADFAEDSDIIARTAEETGLDEDQVKEGVQEAVKMLAEVDAGS